MKSNNSCILLVEGEADRAFFKEICNLLDLNSFCEVKVPQNYAAKVHNGKEGVFIILKRLLNELIDKESSLKKLAIVIDADDDITHGLGFQKSLDRVKNIAKEFGFDLSQTSQKGFIFKQGGLAFGLWIMPDCRDKGMLENFIKTCISPTEQLLFDHAVKVVNKLPEPRKFAEHHHSKAEVATWLAWQEKPSIGLNCTIEYKLLNTDHDLFQALQNWLKQVFAS